MVKFYKRNLVMIAILLLMVLISGIYANIVSQCVSRFNGYTIVLDAGHGGRDGGSVGAKGTIEKDINLEYVLALKDKLISKGYKVILTRKNSDGLYSEFANNKKQSDMEARFKIIKEANPNLVISIHMNSFPSSSVKGASTYYRSGDSSGKMCADLIQESIQTYCGARNQKSKIGDYYILNCSYYSAVLIECGFISNPEEEDLLNSSDYKNKMINAIYNGILLYFGDNHI